MLTLIIVILLLLIGFLVAINETSYSYRTRNHGFGTMLLEFTFWVILGGIFAIMDYVILPPSLWVYRRIMKGSRVIDYKYKNRFKSNS